MSTPQIHAGQRVLDHGYMQLKEVWGSDKTVIEAARMSTSKGLPTIPTYQTLTADRAELRFSGVGPLKPDTTSARAV